MYLLDILFQIQLRHHIFPYFNKKNKNNKHPKDDFENQKEVHKILGGKKGKDGEKGATLSKDNLDSPEDQSSGGTMMCYDYINDSDVIFYNKKILDEMESNVASKM